MTDYLRLVDQAMQLPEELRFELAAVLLGSVDDSTFLRESESWEAWRPEIERRLEALHSGEAELLDADEVITRLRQAVSAARSPAEPS